MDPQKKEPLTHEEFIRRLKEGMARLTPYDPIKSSEAQGAEDEDEKKKKLRGY